MVCVGAGHAREHDMVAGRFDRLRAGTPRSYINTSLIWNWSHSTITIIGWSHRSWYSASSCSREVACTVQVRLM